MCLVVRVSDSDVCACVRVRVRVCEYMRLI